MPRYFGFAGLVFLQHFCDRNRSGLPALPSEGQAAGITGQQAEKAALTFRAMFVKWAPQALQLGSEPVGEGKELYPGLE